MIRKIVSALIFVLLFAMHSYANSASYYVSPNPGYVGDNFRFTYELNSSLPSQYDFMLFLGDGGGGWLSPKTMNPNPERDVFTYERTISTAGLRQYKFAVYENGIAKAWNPSSGSYQYTVEEQPQPDLSISALSVNKTSLEIGDVFRVDATVKNIGNATANSTTLRYYGSSNSTISSSDSPLGTDSVSSLSSGGTSNESISKSATAAGVVYIGVCVDVATGESNSNNNCSNGIRITIKEPEIDSVYASPASVESGSEITFYASLSASLPAGYIVEVNFGTGYKSMDGSGKSYSYYRSAVSSVGANRVFTVRILNGSGSTVDSASGTYTVTAKPDPHSPEISINAASAQATQGLSYSATLAMSDVDGDLKNLQVNWGDGSALSVVELSGGSATKTVTHVYSSAGTFTWNATVRDHREEADPISNKDAVPKTVTVSNDSAPTVTVQSGPSVSGGQLTASVSTSDDIDVTRTSFTIFQSGNGTSLDIQSSVSVVNPASATYNSSANSWGYDPSSTTTTTNWTVDISGLPDGNYDIEFYATDGVNSPATITGKYSFSKLAGVELSVISPVEIGAGDIEADELILTVRLSEALPPGYGVFVNFDDQQGAWFVQTTPGGHIELPHQGGSTYSRTRSLDKPGLRSIRAGIFATLNDADPDNDVLMGGWSERTTCTEQVCLDAVTRSNGYGDPALTGSGSRLFKQVDVANGNYHLSAVDIAVPGKGPSFAFSRAYNALSEESKQWTFGYEAKASYLPDDPFSRQIGIGPLEDGRMLHYFKDMDQKWYALNPGNFDRLIQNPDPDGSFVLYTQGNRLYRFGDPDGTQAGRLQTIEDRLGHALRFGYTNGYLSRVTDANDRDYTITHDGSNRVKRVTDFTQRYVEYTYDSNGMITAVRNMRGGYDRYTYAGTTGNNRYRLATVEDPRENLQVRISYDSSGRVDELVDGVNETTGFNYGTDAGRPITGIVQPAVDDLNHNVGFVLDDARTRVDERVDAQSYRDYRTKQSYEEADDRTRIAELGLVKRIVEPANIAADKGTDIEYSTDGAGNPETITDAAGRENRLGYEAFDSLTNLSLTNLRAVKSVKQVDAGPNEADLITQFKDFTETGEAETIIDPRGFTRSRLFDDTSGWLLGSTNARAFSTEYDHDAFGNVTGITDALNHRTVRRYDDDDLGRLAEETSPLGLTTSYTYDEHGNILTKIEQGPGINYTTRYGYDESDNLVWMEDPRGQRTDYIYDALNRKTEERYKVGGVQHTRVYAYDAMGRLKSVTNERNRTTHTHYTVRSKVKSKVNALAQTTVIYTYDANGNIETATDGEGRTLTYEYDEIDRKTRTTDDQGNYQEWSYNPAGQVETYRGSRGRITHYQYDANGNLTKLTDPEGGITSATYDGNGNQLTVTDPNQHTTTYTYDALDRRATTKLHDGQQWTYSYDANGNLLQEATPNGERTDGERTERVYDALNRVTQLTEYTAADGVARQIAYTYDANGNVESESSGSNSISYTYDEINRVTSVTDQYGQTVGYGYDKAGNWTSLTYPGNKTVSYIYDAANRLESLTDWLNQITRYTRNDAGQPTEALYGNGAKVQYSYDNVGRLLQLTNLKPNGSVISSHDLTLDGAGNITRASMELPLLPTLPDSTGAMIYDDNNRIDEAGSKSYTHDPSGRIIEEDRTGARTIYQFDINDLITAITRNGTTLSSYGYDLKNNRIRQVQSGIETRYVIDQLAPLPNVVAETDALGGVTNYYVYGDGLVSQIGAANDSRYYHFDPTGHTLALTDASGNVTDTYAYTPYGYTTSQGSTGNPFRFVGKHGVMDDGNGLHYMRARYYSEDIKRFVSLDALDGGMLNPQSLNRYAYVLGNPVLGVDPSGLWSVRGYDVSAWWEDNVTAVKNYASDVADNINKAGLRTAQECREYKESMEYVKDVYNPGSYLKADFATTGACVSSYFKNAGFVALDTVDPVEQAKNLLLALVDTSVKDALKVKHLRKLINDVFGFLNLAQGVESVAKTSKKYKTSMKNVEKSIDTYIKNHGNGKMLKAFKGLENKAFYDALLELVDQITSFVVNK